MAYRHMSHELDPVCIALFAGIAQGECSPADTCTARCNWHQHYNTDRKYTSTCCMICIPDTTPYIRIMHHVLCIHHSMLTHASLPTLLILQAYMNVPHSHTGVEARIYMTMAYTHVWSYDHVLYPYMIICLPYASSIRIPV